MTASKEKDSNSPKIFTTNPKGKRKPNKKTTTFKENLAKRQLFSIEKELGLEGLLEGKTVKTTIRMPEKLNKTFIAECKAHGTSSCKEDQRNRVLWLIKVRSQETALSPTISKIVESQFSINGDINFTQNVQSRLRRSIANNPEANLTIDGSPLCEIGTCGEPAVCSGIYIINSKTYRLCSNHANKLGQTGGWRVL